MVILIKYIKLFFLNIFILIGMYNVSAHSILELSNQEKIFLRVSEKYDIELNKKWVETLKEKEDIVRHIKKNNQYDKYKEYMESIKKSDSFRLKNKYIRNLNQSIKYGNKKKIKRYLILLLNIFIEENKNMKEYFYSNYTSFEYIKSNILFKSSTE